MIGRRRPGGGRQLDFKVGAVLVDVEAENRSGIYVSGENLGLSRPKIQLV